MKTREEVVKGEEISKRKWKIKLSSFQEETISPKRKSTV
jgi:hypothetical protein